MRRWVASADDVERAREDRLPNILGDELVNVAKASVFHRASLQRLVRSLALRAMSR